MDKMIAHTNNPKTENKKDSVSQRRNKMILKDYRQQSKGSVSVPTTQLATDITYNTGTFRYRAVNGGPMNQTQIVGTSMDANLDPQDERAGTKPGGDQVNMLRRLRGVYPESHFIRGHLLNGNLGGLGIAENLYPITTEANKQHEKQVENHVKGEIENNREVSYSVNVINRGDTEDNAAATFECEVRDDNGVMLIQKDIHSVPGAANGQRGVTANYHGTQNAYDNPIAYRNSRLPKDWREKGSGLRGNLGRVAGMGADDTIEHNDGTVYATVNPA